MAAGPRPAAGTRRRRARRNTTRRHLDPEVVRRELRVVRADLHCTAARLTGGDADRLEIAATLAADAGLEVWLSPFTCGLTIDALLDVVVDCAERAERAERLRRRGAEVVLLTGSELSLFNVGFMPGDTLAESVGLLATPQRLRELLPGVRERVDDFLRTAVAPARERFGGRVSYASLPFEGVDWTPFDLVSTDAGYRSVEVAEGYRDGIRALVAQGKPVAIIEFGCTTHRGAADLGGRGDSIVEWNEDGTPARLTGDPVRDEDEQATYLRELLDIFAAEGVDTAVVNTFARYDLPHRDDPRTDFDMAGYGVVKVLEDRLDDSYPDMAWEPNAAFAALADRYRG
ncbi:MAG: hypothetical protein GEV28_37250 [Actinophytocola sp.]|uniref:hypothetical protein n=1 Tax=Actinophytocola sp. TaxID=1872138 RepID=UPI001325387B|nr:hypothetical protein [Actinophytocola sp.]MPZ85724.1 hypothetical protein [Actinophytocola sp.]